MQSGASRRYRVIAANLEIHRASSNCGKNQWDYCGLSYGACSAKKVNFSFSCYLLVVGPFHVPSLRQSSSLATHRTQGDHSGTRQRGKDDHPLSIVSGLLSSLSPLSVQCVCVSSVEALFTPGSAYCSQPL